MTAYRTYAAPPIRCALVHGGPGGAGSLAPVARDLSARYGILEPLQTAMTVEGQVEELARTICDHTEEPIVLAGHSWGAWLALLTAAQHPSLVSKLILIGSGPFEEKYAVDIMTVRCARLSLEDREEAQILAGLLGDPETASDPAAFARFGELMAQADTYDPLPNEIPSATEFRPDIFHAVWPEAARLRNTGALLDAAKRIHYPVVAVHGDHDPHPAAGVRDPLSAIIPDFRFILLNHCGHEPWRERQARKRFYELLCRELSV